MLASSLQLLWIIVASWFLSNFLSLQGVWGSSSRALSLICWHFHPISLFCSPFVEFRRRKGLCTFYLFVYCLFFPTWLVMIGGSIPWISLKREMFLYVLTLKWCFWTLKSSSDDVFCLFKLLKINTITWLSSCVWQLTFWNVLLMPNCTGIHIKCLDNVSYKGICFCLNGTSIMLKSIVS